MFNKPTIYGEAETMAEISRLQSALEAEIKNRCCGNCDLWCCAGCPPSRRGENVLRRNPACEHWRTCRSEKC